MGLDSRTIVIAGLVLVVGLVATGPFSALDRIEPEVTDCRTDNEGNIVGCETRGLNLDRNDWERGDDFKLAVRLIEESGDEKPPISKFLFQKGLVSEDINSLDDADYPQDFTVDSEKLAKIENSSVCSMNAAIGSPGEFTFEYKKDGETFTEFYNDEPDSDEVAADKLMDPVNVEAESIEIRDGEVICSFSIEDILDENQHNGKFVEWSGRYPTFAGGNDGGSLTDVSVEFREGSVSSPVESDPVEDMPTYGPDPSPTPEEPVETPDEPERKSIFSLILDILVFWK